MTDKVQKIRAEVERLYVYWDGVMQSSAATEAVARKNQCKELLSFIDSIQGKQVDYGKLKTSLDNALSKETKESCEKFLQEEHVSDDLDEAAQIYARGEYDRKNPSSLHWQCKGCYSPLIYAFKDGAQWQKEQFEKNRLEHCDSITNEQAELEQKFLDQHLDKYNRMPTFLDAIEYGMRLKEEQMMEHVHDGAYIRRNR